MRMNKIQIAISKMEHEELTQITYALIRNWNRIHPEDELVVLSLPKNDSKNRIRVLRETWRLLLGQKNSSIS